MITPAKPPAGSQAARPIPRDWRPQAALAAYFPAIAALCRAVLPEIRQLEHQLDRDEAAGCDTVRLRQAIGELLWRLQYTGDAEASAKALNRVRALARGAQEAVATRDADGSFGIGTEVWFLKLDASVDPMLADDFDAGANPPRFLDQINRPDRLWKYLTGLVFSHLEKDGIDRRKELNFATADLVRLILRRRPRGYPWDPQLDAVVRRFIAEWQDPATGFFGADYEIDGERWRTVDLSMTFHMARYLEGRIGHWPQLIDTLFAIRDDRYPYGWLDEDGITSHNNYDVAVLFSLGWPHMSTDQRERARHELGRLLAWCLETAIAPDGTVVVRAVGESLPDSYYFTIAFLDAVGFFDPAKRFWTDRALPGAEVLRAKLASRVHELHPNDPMVPMALARLRRRAVDCGPGIQLGSPPNHVTRRRQMPTTLDAEARRDVRIEDVEYQRQGGRPMLARLYRPSGAGPFPAVLQVHGGAWVNKDRTDNDFIAKALAANGIFVVSIDFRMPPEAPYPASLADINLATRWLKANALEFRSRAEWVGSFGTSSGGHQVLLAAMRPDDPRYSALWLADAPGIDARLAFVISGWGVLDPLLRYELAKQAGNAELLENHHNFWGDAATMAEGNPPRILERREPVELPPALVFGGDKDEWVPVELMTKFVADYQNAGGEVELQLYEGANHGFMTGKPDAPYASRAIERMIDFIRKHTIG